METAILVLTGLVKKTHMLRCAQSPRSNVTHQYASARRFLSRLASEIFLTSLSKNFFNALLRKGTVDADTMVEYKQDLFDNSFVKALGDTGRF
jgi:hypothetical protein